MSQPDSPHLSKASPKYKVISGRKVGHRKTASLVGPPILPTERHARSLSVGDVIEAVKETDGFVQVKGGSWIPKRLKNGEQFLRAISESRSTYEETGKEDNCHPQPDDAGELNLVPKFSTRALRGDVSPDPPGTPEMLRRRPSWSLTETELNANVKMPQFDVDGFLEKLGQKNPSVRVKKWHSDLSPSAKARLNLLAKEPSLVGNKMLDEGANWKDTIRAVETGKRVQKERSLQTIGRAAGKRLSGPAPDVRCSSVLDSNPKRAKILEEIVESEERYLSSLICLTAEFAESKELSGIIDSKSHQNMFDNIQIIATFHKAFLRELLFSSSLVAVFKKNVNFLLIYTDFVNNYDSKVIKTYNKLRDNDSFQKFLLSKQQEGNDLMSMMITPIQRIPRYELLLKELQKNTPTDHAESQALSECVQKISVIATRINESKRKFEGMNKIITLTGQINLLQHGRFFIYDAPLCIKTWCSYEKRHFYLFNDVLVYTESSRILGAISLIDADMEETFDIPNVSEDNLDELKYRFMITGMDALKNEDQKQSKMCWKLIAEKRENLDKWIANIANQIAALCVPENLALSPQNSVNSLPLDTSPRPAGRGLDFFVTDEDDVQLALSDVDKYGWLLKQGVTVKSWKKRFFVLKGLILTYHKDPHTNIPLGTVDLKGCEIRMSSVRTDFCCFEIYHPDRRTYYLYSEQETTSIAWMEALSSNIRAEKLRVVRQISLQRSLTVKEDLSVYEALGVVGKIETLCGEPIALKTYHKEFISANDDGTLTVRNNIGKSETFTLEKFDEWSYSVKSCHGTYISVKNGEVLCTEGLAEANCFEFNEETKFCKDKWSLKTSSQTYLRASIWNSVDINPYVSEWELFEIVKAQ